MQASAPPIIISRRRLLGIAGAIAAPAFIRRARAAPQVRLKLQHDFSSISQVHTGFLVPWSKRIEADSDGRIGFEIFASMQLGGRPAELFDQARDGNVDIAWTRPSLTPGRFPLVEAFELPFVPSPHAFANSLALQDYAAAHAQAEFGDVRPLAFAAQDHGVVHAHHGVKGEHDLRGLKIHAPTRWSSDALRALGAAAMTVPGPQVAFALGQRVINGCLLCWERAATLKVDGMVRFHTDIRSSPTLCTTTHMLVMNKARYESMPEDLRAILDRHCGQSAAAMAATVWDGQAATLAEKARERGNPVASLASEEIARWRRRTRPVIDAWIAEIGGRSVDGIKLLAAARALVEHYERPYWIDVP